MPRPAVGRIIDAIRSSGIFRDIHAAGAHIAVAWDINGAEFGRVAVGLPLGNPNV